MSKKLSKEEKKNKKKVKPGRLAKREALTGLLFVSPWIVGAVMFLAYPLITSFWYALNNIRITPLGKNFTFLGYGNFTQILLSDADFPTQLIDYLVSTIISVPVIVVFALIIAMMLNENIKAKGFFRLIFFLPVIIVSGPILGMLNQQGAGSITAIDTQAISSAITTFLPSAIGKPIAEIFENMVTILWYSGVQILIFLSGLQKIDRSMYEAAKIDGGSGWECFWKITLPTIKPLILLNCVYTIVFISNNDQNSIIELIKNAMFSGTAEKGYGYASAMAWLYSIVVLLIVGLFALLFVAKKDVYEKQVKKAKKAMKKEQRLTRKIERRSARNAKKIQKARTKRNYSTYNGNGDY
uniref:carbohydrate ABC transporter permease n=1 Tax=Roseburia sp. TaxID=2049040 RepID=UPI003FEDF564